MSHTSGIYQIRNIINGHIYIGSTIDIQKRWSSHVRLLNNNTHHSRHLQNAWNKYGEQAFEFSVLLQVDDVSSLLDIEQEFLDERAPEYNMSPTAGSSLGVKCTEETKRKISEANTGRHLSEETRAKLSKAHKGNRYSEETRRKMSEAKKCNTNSLGYKHTEETRAKMSAARKGNTNCLGKVLTEEHKRKLSKSQKGRVFTEEHKRKISEAKKGMPNGRLGKCHSEETKRKISEAHKGRAPWNKGKHKTADGIMAL